MSHTHVQAHMRFDFLELFGKLASKTNTQKPTDPLEQEKQQIA